MTVAINVRPVHSIADPKPKTVVHLKFSSYWCCAPLESGRKIIASAGSIITDVRVKPFCCTILCCPPDKTKEKEKESAGIRLFKLHLSHTYGNVVGNSAPCVAGINLDKMLNEGDFLRLDQLNEITETATQLKEALTNETVAFIENGIVYYLISLSITNQSKLEFKKNENLQEDPWKIDIKRKSFSQDDIKKEIAKIPFENTLTDDESQKLLTAVNEALLNNKIETLDCLEARQIIIKECLKLKAKIITPKTLRAQPVVISYFFMKQQIENTASGHEHWGNLFYQYLKDKFGEFPARVAFYEKYKEKTLKEIAMISLEDAVGLEGTAIKASQSFPSLKASLKQLQYYHLKDIPLLPALVLDKKSSKNSKLMVRLDNGSIEEFSRDKMKGGISKILTKDALIDQAIEDIIDVVIKHIEKSGETEITKKNLRHYVAYVMHSSEVVILKHEIQKKLEKLERESSPLIRSLCKMPFFDLTNKQLYLLFRATQSHGKTQTQHQLKVKASHVASPIGSQSFT